MSFMLTFEYADCRKLALHAEWLYVYCFMLSVIMLRVIMLSIVMLFIVAVLLLHLFYKTVTATESLI